MQGDCAGDLVGAHDAEGEALSLDVRGSAAGLVLTVGLAAALAGCGGGAKSGGQATTAAVPDAAAAMRALIAKHPTLGGTVRTLYQGSSWAVVQSVSGTRASAVAFRLVGGRWQADRSGKVKIAVLGPEPGAHTVPEVQVAIEFTAPSAFVESALWVDGKELLEKGGGSPTGGTIYGSPAHALKPGRHVAVGYARTATRGTAVAWVFSVG